MFDYISIAYAIRSLSLDAINLSKSGHPGMPLGMADVASVLIADFLKFNSSDPTWINRDRFILSAGHGSMLLYSMLYLTGYIKLEDIKNFRKLHSKTAGHPEYSILNGIENTSGPLGQGFALAVGIALGERIINSKCPIINHYTYVMCGDGCLMEGISHEAASLAGHLALSKLIVLFDDNNISIDGSISLSSSDDVAMRFESYNWNVIKIDGHNYSEIRDAISVARNSSRKPSLICCKTVIGKGMLEVEGSEKAHSYTLNSDEVIKYKKALTVHEKFNTEIKSDEFKPFFIPNGILDSCLKTNKVEEYNLWHQNLTTKEKELISKLNTEIDCSESWFDELNTEFARYCYKESTRKSSGRVVDLLAKKLDFFIGGSADLTKSNFVKAEGCNIINKNSYKGKFIHYGIREHAMAACMNGLALYNKNIIAYGGTFLIFSDYARPAIRMAALMNLRVIFVMTHDSIGVGEDGPTHQPVEHLASFRAMPNLFVFRPCDSEEVLCCWKIAIKLQNPSIIALSRQDLPFITKSNNATKAKFGAYIIDDCNDNPDFIIFATGSEVEIAIQTKKMLSEKNFSVRVISVPCFELFFIQSKDYIEHVLDKNTKTIKVAIEAASSFGWEKFIGNDGVFIGIDTFGSSAPYGDLYKHYKITPEDVFTKCIAKKEQLNDK